MLKRDSDWISSVHTSSRAGLGACLTMMGALTCVLWLDSDGGLWLQRGLGLATWGVLLLALRRVNPVVQVQTLVVVAFATSVEYLFSPTLEVYLYRFDNVPAYVPPGHGLVYLSAFALGHTRFVERHMRACLRAVLVVGGIWAAYGVFLAERTDVLGAFWYVCLVGFLLCGPSKGVYVGAFVAVSYLELVGTSLGTWTWQLEDPTGWVAIGNPPSGAAGGYGWFDLAGLLLAPYLLRLFSRRLPQDRPSLPEPGVVDGH